MNSSIRREALKAAAKVAMSISAVAACGGTTLTNVGSSPTESNPDEAQAATSDELRRADAGARIDAAPTDAGARPGTKKDASVPPTNPVDAAVVTNLDVASCNATLDTISPDAGWDEQLPKNAGLTPCCEVILKDYNHQITNFDGGAWPNETHRWGCCTLIREGTAVVEAWYSEACTPWGPPMPPAFFAFALAEVA